MMQKTYLLILTLISSFLLGCAMISIAQNAPITTCATVAGAMPGSVSVPVTVTGFTNIGAVSLTLDYDYSVLHYVQGSPNPLLPGFLSGDFDLGNGFHRISMGWYGSSNTIADGSTIMTLIFNYISGNSPLNWFDNGSSCEYADPMGNALNDIPGTTYYLNGYLCGATGNPGPVIGNYIVCQGQTGEPYSIAPLANVDGYNWTVPAGAVIAGGQGTNSITVNFSGTAVSGDITVYGFNPCGNGPLSQIPVTVNQPPFANAGNDITINYGTSTTLHAASGGTGTFSYHWMPEALLVNPNVQNPQTVILTTTTLFTVVVTNLASPSCPTSDEVIVTITGGPLSVNPVAIPGNICHGENSQLYSNAGGGSGSYTYLWTSVPPGTPPWSSTVANPLVSPASSTLYQLSVNDGFTNTAGSVNLTVSPLPTATISGGDTLCGSGNVTALQVDLTGTPPWSFTYTNGINSVTLYSLYTTPYYIITGTPGTYTLLGLQDANCAGTSYGTASVYVFPYPATPEITVVDYTLISNVCCGNQWYLNNAAIPGATGQSITATTSGWYYDIVTMNSCSSDTSEIIGLTVGINDVKEMKFSLSPNPAHDVVNIRCNGGTSGSVRITVTSSDGGVFRRYTYRLTDERHEILSDISGLRPGMYFVTISSDHACCVNKLIVK
jgi:hypothetical protein